MILWRISNYADLLGIGGMYASARWHTAGRPVVYLAENPSAALLEVLVHLEMDEEHQPDSFDLHKEVVPPESLRLGWRANEAITRAIGDEWLLRSSSALLRVPSGITPETYNWVLNPRHSDAKSVGIVHIEKHLYDSRLLKR